MMLKARRQLGSFNRLSRSVVVSHWWMQIRFRRSYLIRLWLLLCISMHFLIVCFQIHHNSANVDEFAHLVAGVSHRKFGSFDLYRVNPPLVRMVAALAVFRSDEEADWSSLRVDSPYSRAEFIIGRDYVRRHGFAAFSDLTIARWLCLPFGLVALWVCYSWASQLYGPISGVLAVSLLCCCPSQLAWASSITPDAAAASLGVLAGYAFWLWLQRPTLLRAVAAAVALGVAELTKSTWIILFGIWPLLWALWKLQFQLKEEKTEIEARAVEAGQLTLPPSENDVESKATTCTFTGSFAQLLAILIGGVYIINLGYGFEGSFRPLGEYHFVSHMLTGEDRPPHGGNRFRNSWIGDMLVPLPENYLRGIDVQKFEFEQRKWSYLLGEHKKGGWLHYYVYGIVVKTPVGTLALFGLATVCVVVRRGFSAGWRNELALLVPTIAILMLVSSQIGFSRHLRYVLPAMPFLHIYISRVALVFSRRERWLSVMVCMCVTASMIESILVFPHHMSFFNWLVGGPLSGPRHLLDSNIDWGQDLLFLKQWYDEHPEARPLHVAYFGSINVPPEIAGIDSEPVPGLLPERLGKQQDTDLSGPQPGWFAVSVNHLRGYRHYENDLPKYIYFQRLKPVDRAGYSIYIYHITRDEANSLRSQLGLPPLDEDSSH